MRKERGRMCRKEEKEEEMEEEKEIFIETRNKGERRTPKNS